MQEVRSDIIIIGAGAAGLMCAMEAGKRGRRVVVLDHAARAAEKVRISGGGRCNFTNLYTAPENFLSRNPRFCVSALSRYTPDNFISLVEKHGIAYHEKTKGQLFCDGLSNQIVSMLLAESRDAGVTINLQTTIEQVSRTGDDYQVRTSRGIYSCSSLVIASGGLSIPKMGATNFGYRVATQFDLPIVPPEPALVPFTMPEAHVASWQSLAGVAVEATVQCGKRSFRGGLLFTHRGLSGPAVLQISSYWNPGDRLSVNLAPDHDTTSLLLHTKREAPRQEPLTPLQNILPKRLAQQVAELHLAPGSSRLADVPNRQLTALADAVNLWEFIPNGTEGYRTAEVTRGGVDTDALSSKTMECKAVPRLFFIGEVVDVTGQLGGFNFQWAWASGYVAGQYA